MAPRRVTEANMEQVLFVGGNGMIPGHWLWPLLDANCFGSEGFS